MSGRRDASCGPSRWRYWVRMGIATVAAAFVVLVFFSGITWRTSARDVGATFATALLFAVCIGPALSWAMPRVSSVIWTRMPFPLNWAAACVVMIAVAMVGTGAAIGILRAVGVVPRHLVAAWFFNSLRVSIIITLTFGLFITATELMRDRLDQAALALRTKERDEAHARQVAVEAQLASLESRVHPHFLFNTLNSIAALIPQDPASAERVVEQLASLLRFSLDLDPLVTLERELKVVNDYLAIERVRFDERLRYRFEADRGAEHALVPRLSIQTLVENSIKYAVSPRREGATVVVSAAIRSDTLTISVADDGPGFVDPQAEGHGLSLLRSRLAAQFGGAASLVVAREAGWTTVRVTVPLQIEEPLA